MGSFSQKKASMKSSLVNNTPCFNTLSDSTCFESVVRLAYLNQQSDGGSLALRRGRDCLTQDELNDISNKQERENHPLNCAKLNAKPYPYFDAGVVCVRGTDASGEEQTCAVDTNTGVLQDTNYAITTDAQRISAKLKEIEGLSDCDDEANSNSAANDQGASS